MIRHEIYACTIFSKKFEDKTWLEVSAKLELWKKDTPVTPQNKMRELELLAQKYNFFSVQHYIATFAPLRIHEFMDSPPNRNNSASKVAVERAIACCHYAEEFFLDINDFETHLISLDSIDHESRKGLHKHDTDNVSSKNAKMKNVQKTSSKKSQSITASQSKVGQNNSHGKGITEKLPCVILNKLDNTVLDNFDSNKEKYHLKNDMSLTVSSEPEEKHIKGKLKDSYHMPKKVKEDGKNVIRKSSSHETSSDTPSGQNKKNQWKKQKVCKTSTTLKDETVTGNAIKVETGKEKDKSVMQEKKEKKLSKVNNRKKETYVKSDMKAISDKKNNEPFKTKTTTKILLENSNVQQEKNNQISKTDQKITDTKKKLNGERKSDKVSNQLFNCTDKVSKKVSKIRQDKSLKKKHELSVNLENKNKSKAQNVFVDTHLNQHDAIRKIENGAKKLAKNSDGIRDVGKLHKNEFSDISQKKNMKKRSERSVSQRLHDENQIPPEKNKMTRQIQNSDYQQYFNSDQKITSFRSIDSNNNDSYSSAEGKKDKMKKSCSSDFSNNTKRKLDMGSNENLRNIKKCRNCDSQILEVISPKGFPLDSSILRADNGEINDDDINVSLTIERSNDEKEAGPQSPTVTNKMDLHKLSASEINLGEKTGSYKFATGTSNSINECFSTIKQPHTNSNEQSADVAAEQLAEVAAEQLADVAAEQSADVAAEQSADVAAQQSADVAAQQSADAAAQQSADVAAKQSADVAAKQSC